ncbi:MAG: hypothetical protein AVDCRST_MAG66-2233, partial [uncultured Pseudonocardia sp.]
GRCDPVLAPRRRPRLDRPRRAHRRHGLEAVVAARAARGGPEPGDRGRGLDRAGQALVRPDHGHGGDVVRARPRHPLDLHRRRAPARLRRPDRARQRGPVHGDDDGPRVGAGRPARADGGRPAVGLRPAPPPHPPRRARGVPAPPGHRLRDL